jgi:hypothetical protein
MSKARKDNWLESEDFLSELDQILEFSKNAKLKREIIGWEGYEELHYHLNTCNVSERAIQAVMDLIVECRKLRLAVETKELESILA